MAGKSFPCIICGKELESVIMQDSDELEAQPHGGVMCQTYGNYGSTVFDPFNGMLAFNICDNCLVEAGEKGRVFLTYKPYVPIKYVYRQWRKGLENQVEN